MATVGFNFTKMSAEKNPVSGANVTIQSNAGITSIKEVRSIDAKKSMLKFGFHFLCKYEPGLGKIEMDGEIIEIFDKDFASKVMDTWTKNNKVHPEVLQTIFNTILARSNMEAILISRDLGLPSPIQMPRIDVKTQKPEAAKTDKPKVEAKKK